MTVDTPFDMASITKVEATTAAILHLVGRGKLSLDDRLGTLLPVSAIPTRPASPCASC